MQPATQLPAVETPMIRVNVPSVGALRSLEPVPLNTGFVHVVLDGQVQGQLWADRLDSPRVFHARHPYGMSLVWGDDVAEGIDQILNHLRNGEYRTDGDEWLQIDPRWQALDWDQRLGAVAAESAVESTACSRHTRVNFSFDEQRFQQIRSVCALPDGWRLRRATAADFALHGQVVPRHFWRDAEQFLTAGGGWCAEQDGCAAAIAFVSYRWGNDFEIGIETLAHARRRGLGRAVAIRLITDVLQTGLRPVWSCRMENISSYNLAQTLGFLPKLALPYYRLRQHDTALMAW